MCPMTHGTVLIFNRCVCICCYQKSYYEIVTNRCGYFVIEQERYHVVLR